MNVCRGPVVEEQALFDALRSRGIAGAALDVWYRYPAEVGERVYPASLPFWELDNVVMTPHSSGWTASTLDGRWRFIAGQIQRLGAGLPLETSYTRPSRHAAARVRASPRTSRAPPSRMR